MQEQMTKLVERDGYRMVHHRARADAQSDTLVITFNHLGLGLVDKGFGSEFLSKNGYDNINVSTAKGTFYQNLSVEDFWNGVAEISAGYDRVFTYGSSLGAYCALYFAGAVDATALAFGPKCSALPYAREVDRAQGVSSAGAQVEVRHVDLSAVPRSSRAPIVIYDPEVPWDHAYVSGQVRPCYADAQIVEVPFAGHQVAATFSREALLKGFVLNALATGRADPVSIPPARLPMYHLHMAKQSIADKARDEAIHHILSLFAMTPGEPPFWLVRSYMMEFGEAFEHPPEPSAQQFEAALRQVNVDACESIADFYLAMAKVNHNVNNFDRARVFLKLHDSASETRSTDINWLRSNIARLTSINAGSRSA